MTTPPSTSEPIQPHTLLCEMCGYVIEGQDSQDKCSECGTPVRASLPWVKRRETRSTARVEWGEYLRLGGALLSSPRRTFAALPIQPEFATRIWWVSVRLSTLALMIAWLVAMQGAWAPVPDPAWVILGPACIPLLLWILTAIEYTGIQFFGRRREWRLTPAVARVIVGYASVGWLVGALACCVIAGVVQLSTLIRWSSTPYGHTPLLFLHALGPIIGLLTFETLVYFGVRACKFANLPRERPAPGADAPA